MSSVNYTQRINPASLFSAAVGNCAAHCARWSLNCYAPSSGKEDAGVAAATKIQYDLNIFSIRRAVSWGGPRTRRCETFTMRWKEISSLPKRFSNEEKVAPRPVQRIGERIDLKLI